MTSIVILLSGAGTPSCSLSLWGCLLTDAKCFLEKWSASRTVLPKVPSDQYSLKGTGLAYTLSKDPQFLTGPKLAWKKPQPAHLHQGRF